MKSNKHLIAKGLIVFILSVPFLIKPNHASGQSWSANWIWTSDQGPNNTWLSFRKKVTLSAKPSKALTRIAAENKYWLYVNDVLVVKDGGLDIRPDLNNTYYDEIDLAPYLKSGENIIATLVWYKGGASGYSQRTVSNGGFLLQAGIEGASPASIVTDNTWKVKLNPAFNRGTFNFKYGVSGTITFDNTTFGDPIPNVLKAGYYRVTGSGNPWTKCADEWQSFTLPGVCDVAYGSENNQLRQWDDYKWVAWPVSYDAANAMQNWQAAGYDDSNWGNSVNKGAPPVAPWNMLKPRTIPFWKDHGLTAYNNPFPSTISTNTTITEELGINIQGTPYLKVNAPAGVRIKIILNDFYFQEYITKQGVQEFECYAWQNSSSHTVKYEFSNVTGTVTILDLKFRQTSYNTDIRGSFSCNDASLNKLWIKCKNTSLVCMRDIYYDCPNRERGQWWGDVSEQILYSFYLYDENADLLTKKGFRELFNSQKTDGSLYTTAPGTAFGLPDQNMAAVAMLWKYYRYTGDAALLQEIYPQAKKFIDYCASTANSDGMLILQTSQGNNLWNWIDWGSNKDIVDGSANTICNAIYAVLLDAMSNVADVVGASADKTYYQTLLYRVKANFNYYFWNSAANAYVFHRNNGVQSSVIDDRSNAWAVLAGMADDAKKPGVLTVLKNRYNASPYQEMYIEMAMSMLSPNDALTRMRSRYAAMIDSWSSTLWEEFPASNSNNHAWSAGPLYQLSAWVLGVQPTQPAYNEFVFQPQVTDLTSISAKVPSVKGDITASYNRATNMFTQALTSPPNTVAIVAVPKGMLANGVKQINANDVVVWKNGAATGSVAGLAFLSEDNAYIRFRVQPGAWTFRAYDQVSTGNEPVVLYLDCNYTGKAVALPVGNYSLPDLIARGIPNDSVSSIKVMNGYRAILYWDTDFGGNSLVRAADDPCLDNVGWNDALSSVSVQPITTKIEAETYSSYSGVISESCSEGTLNVGAIDQGDWMAYSNVVVPQTGTYRVEYRVASLYGGGQLTLDINAGSVVLDTLDIPSTGGWQNWQTLSGTFYLTKGTYNFGLYAQSGGWNINWFAFTPVDVSAAARTGTVVRAGEQEPAGDQRSAVKIFPNPASNVLTLYPGNSGYRYLYITNATGHTVVTKVLPQHASSVTIDVSGLGKGVYYALLKGGRNGDVVRKVVIE